MLLVVFQVAQDRFGLDAGLVVEIVPLAALRQAHHAPGYAAGLFNYRGTVVPVIDLTALLTGHPCPRLLSTRIMLVTYTDAGGTHHVLGLLAERVLETAVCTAQDFQSPGIASPEAPYLGDVLVDGDQMLRRITVAELLPRSVQELLFTACGEAG
jgi:chemotaxis-related protein WspB